MTCPHCHATLTAESICESVWEGCRTGSMGLYSCCGGVVQVESVHQATRSLTNNAHLATQVRDLQPPYDNLQVIVAGAYRTVLEAQIRVTRIMTTKARSLFGREFYDKTGSGTRQPVVIGTFNNEPLLIDGIHRINDAANAGTEYIPYFHLNAEQTQAITMTLGE